MAMILACRPSWRAVDAMIASLPHYEEEARERMVKGGDTAIRKGREKIPYPEQGKASEQAAAAFGVNPRYVSDATRRAVRFSSRDNPASDAAFARSEWWVGARPPLDFAGISFSSSPTGSPPPGEIVDCRPSCGVLYAANRARSEKAKERPRKANGTLASGRTSSAPTGPKQDSRNAKAASLCVDRGAVQRTAKIKKMAGERRMGAT